MFVYFREHPALRMLGGDHRLSVDCSRFFNDPVTCLFRIVAACVADKDFYFPVLIRAGSHPKHIVSLVPKGNFTTAYVAVAVGRDRLGKPNAVLEPESFVSQGAYRAYIDHIS